MISWITIFLLSCVSFRALSAYHVVCIYTNWSQYRPDIGRFVPEDVDPSLCTHLIYVYAKLKGSKLVASEWNDEGTSWSEGMFDRMQNLKQMNPELKTLLGVGGWMMGSKDFSRLAARPGSRRMFASSTTKFLRDRNFDGLTIDWQYPTRRGGKPYDRKNFSLLLKELRKAFDEESKKSKSPSLMLTVGVSASRDIIDSAYEIDNITRYTDFINVMAYDLHGPWDNYTGHPSQLYARKEEFGPSTEVNVDAVMRYWISSVPDRSKLILGTSTYGRSFTLRKQRHNEYNVPTKGPGVAGEYTKQPGMLAYYERCNQYTGATRVWDDYSKVAYWYQGDQWTAGEDTESLKAKVRWMKQFNAGGISIWSLDTDDFYDICSNGTYPLLNAIQTEIEAPYVYISTTVPTTTAYLDTTEVFTSPSAETMKTTSRKSTKISSAIQHTVTDSKGTSKRKQSAKENKLNSSDRNKSSGSSGSKHLSKESKKGVTKTTSKQKQFRSRNEKPNTDKKSSKPIREGNRIVVRRKKVIKRRKNGETAKQNKNSKTKDKIQSNKSVTKQPLPKQTTIVNVEKGQPQKHMSNDKTKANAQSKVKGKRSDKGKMINSPNNKTPIHVKTKAEPLKMEISNAEKSKQSKNGGKSAAKPKRKNGQGKGKGKRRGRKVKRRKLTKKQIEMLRRRRNRQRQLQRKRQLENNKQPSGGN